MFLMSRVDNMPFVVCRVGGWNQKARPFLHNAFHVGDQVVSINFQVR